MNDLKGLKVELTEDLGDRVIEHRNRFVRIMTARYWELLPELITYENKTENLSQAIDFLKVEVGLRGGYDIAIGLDKKQKLVLLGSVATRDTVTDPTSFFKYRKCLTQNDINFVIPSDERLPKYKEITRNDPDGNFVILRNKPLCYSSDFEIIEHYIAEMCEIVVSRFSITMQLKIMTFFISERNDETVNEVVNNIYNGQPFTKVDKFFDPKSQMVEYHSDNGSSNLVELKREYQNKISELNNMIGVHSLAVEKNSGVSDVEAKGNRAFTASNANIYLAGRQNGLDLLNQVFGTQLNATYNDEVTSEFNKIENITEVGAHIEENNNTL